MTRTPRLAAAAAALLLLAAAGGCSARAEKAALPAAAGAPPRAVRVAKPATRIETGLARATGTVRAREEATLAAKGTGQIRRIRVDVGDRVKAGAALVEMDAANQRIGLENAKAAERLAAANLAAAERELARAKELRAQDALPQSGFDRAETARDIAAAQLDQARAAVHAAEQQLADTVITAPFPGVVTAKLKNVGDTVTMMPVTPIVAVTNVDALEVRLAVPESIEHFAVPGRAVKGKTTPGGQPFEARVRVKSAVVDPQSRTVEVLADVRPGALRPGTLVTVDLGAVGEKAGLFLPASAVQSADGKSWVYVLAGGKAERREITASLVHPGTYAVEAGLDAAADVILDPGTLAPGDAVVALAN
jgi:RND family efflux transporter MFP subunit